ncbi:programmed cell death 6-interacting protein-like [Stegodyphus dumicola]|uniref:programmed cell death 6-interacting protein-like n=1 Tax=Stegodyphus dumicola TaxID=202533 RepID=UPI0015AF56D0|nr:programmed cell death 6-interacting protein-like [Stegodyphus dumicola]
MQSQIACSYISDTKNDEGLKLAAKYFQMASGTFQHLKTLASSPAIEEPTPDLRPDTISALQALMLAQAQESFFFKATSDNMKDTVIARVASRAEELYADALKLMQKESVQHLWERKALDLMKVTETKGILTSDLRDYQARITHNYEEAKKDNDFIYHARIPDHKSLPPIGKAALAKPILPGEKLNPNSQDLFSALLPVAVQQAMSAFELRKMEIVNGEKAKLQSETQMLNGILASLNLPAALEDTTGNCLPQSLREKAAAVQEKGGMETIQRLLNELPSLLQRNNEILKESERLLNDEEESDQELRSKFGREWVRTPSSKLNEPLKSNIQKYSQIISTAVSADAIVKEKYEKHKDKIALLCLPEEQLLSGIPTGSPLASCPSVDKLKSLMHEVEALKAERETLLGELESAATDMKAKFMSALGEGGVNEQALSLETLGEIYGPIQKRIRDNIAKQEQLVHDIQVANNEFSQEKNTGGSAGRRESMLSDLASAHDAYMELLRNLEEGSKFYNNLTEVLVNFQNKINDFCFARKTEKEDFCKDLQKNIVTEASQPTPLAPPRHNAVQKPARPPPPTTSATTSAPSSQTWSYPPATPDAASQQQPQQPLPYPAYTGYPYPYPPGPNVYNPYGQIVMPPYPPAPGYQGQPPLQQQQQATYATYPPTSNYPYPQQPYRPWPQ